MRADEKPDIRCGDTVGTDMQNREIEEAVELPRARSELYKQIEIDSQRGVLPCVAPGCGESILQVSLQKLSRDSRGKETKYCKLP